MTWLRARQFSFIERGAKVNALSPRAPGLSPDTVTGSAGMVAAGRTSNSNSAANQIEDLLLDLRVFVLEI